MKSYAFDEKAFFKELGLMKDFRILVLFVHLNIEFWMNKLIEIEISRPKIIMQNNDFKTFSNKLDLLYATDIIEDKNYQQIKLVNKIRNHYAHNIVLTEEFPEEVKGLMNSLITLSKMESPPAEATLEQKYVLACCYLVGYLNGRYEVASRQRGVK